jgi:hypothetical protein
MTVYLDFDGVLNPFPFDPNPFTTESPWTDFTAHTVSLPADSGYVRQFVVNVSQTAADALWEASNGAVTWHTTWNEGNFANRFLSPLFGWSSLFRAPFLDKHVRHSWWKLEALLSLERDGVLPDRFVWIDDDLKFEQDALDWCKDRGCLPLSPDSHVGLTEDHLDQIKGFYG